jgi:adenine-specific DNA methylase
LPLSTNRGALNQAQKFVLVGGSVESVHYLQFCLHWFDQYAWQAGPFGQADVLARAKGTSVSGVQSARSIMAR